MSEKDREPVNQATATTTLCDGVPVVAVAGEIDMSTADMVRAEVTRQWTTSPDALILDLDAVTFFDSSGLALLIDTHQTAQRRGVPLAVVVTGRVVPRLLQVTELHLVLSVHTNVTDAVSAVRATATPTPDHALTAEPEAMP